MPQRNYTDIIQFPAGAGSGEENVKLWFQFQCKEFSAIREDRLWDPTSLRGGGKGGPLTTIILPMPPNLASEQRNNFSSKNTPATFLVSEGVTFEDSQLEEAFGAVKAQLMLQAQKFGLNVTDMKDNVFESSAPRTFSFKYVMIAKTLAEANIITNICQRFKLFSLPTATAYRGRVQSPPFWTWAGFSIIDGKVKKLDKEEQATWTDNAQISVLSNISIDRTGANGITPVSGKFDDDQILPIVTTLNLTFNEVEPNMLVRESLDFVNRSTAFVAGTGYDPGNIVGD